MGGRARTSLSRSDAGASLARARSGPEESASASVPRRTLWGFERVDIHHLQRLPAMASTYRRGVGSGEWQRRDVAMEMECVYVRAHAESERGVCMY